MNVDYSYMEVVAKPETTKFENVSLDQLTQAMYRSAIHTFGWPVAAVIFNTEDQPQPIEGGIEARFKNEGHREYWSLKRTGEFYFIGELFENNRLPSHVFIDTRTNRIAESFLRVGKLYLALGVPENEMIFFMIRHGNIKGKILGAGNTARVFPYERKCNVNEVKTEFSIPLKEMVTTETLKQNVYSALRDLAEMFDMFNPDKGSFTDPIVDAFVLGKII